MHIVVASKTVNEQITDKVCQGSKSWLCKEPKIRWLIEKTYQGSVTFLKRGSWRRYFFVIKLNQSCLNMPFTSACSSAHRIESWVFVFLLQLLSTHMLLAGNHNHHVVLGAHQPCLSPNYVLSQLICHYCFESDVPYIVLYVMFDITFNVALLIPRCRYLCEMNTVFEKMFIFTN